MFEHLIELIRAHPRYGPALAHAAAQKQPLVLNYHIHPGAEDYCVSVCARLDSPLAMLDLGGTGLEELAHIRGFGATEEDCGRLTAAFGRELQQAYRLDRTPEPWLQGAPLRPHGE